MIALLLSRGNPDVRVFLSLPGLSRKYHPHHRYNDLFVSNEYYVKILTASQTEQMVILLFPQTVITFNYECL